MEYKILEANGVENENIDGAAFNNFTAGGRSGIIKGILNECVIYQPSSNSIGMGTGELIIHGFRIKITQPFTQTFSSLPAMPTEYSLIGRIQLNPDRTVLFEVSIEPTNTILVQDDLYAVYSGKYEIEIARFTLSSDGVSDLGRKVKILDGNFEIRKEDFSVIPSPSSVMTRDEHGMSQVITEEDGHGLHDRDENLDIVNRGYAKDHFVSKINQDTIVYGTTTTGEQKAIPWSFGAVGNTVCVRNGNRQLGVGMPTAGSHATPKEYVDAGLNELDSKIDNSVENLEQSKLDKEGGTITKNLVIQGNLTVQGASFVEDNETLTVKENIIVTNSDGIDLQALLSGIAIRVDQTSSYGIMYDPSGDGVKIGLGKIGADGEFTYDTDENNESEGQFLATRSDKILDKNIPVWNDTKKQFEDSRIRTGTMTKIGAVSFGYNCESTAMYSYSQNLYCKATQMYTHSGGSSSEANIMGAFVHGNVLRANLNPYEAIFGEFNEPVQGAILSVGNGESDSKRRNALVFMEDGSDVRFYPTFIKAAKILDSFSGGRTVTLDLTADGLDLYVDYARNLNVLSKDPMFVSPSGEKIQVDIQTAGNNYVVTKAGTELDSSFAGGYMYVQAERFVTKTNRIVLEQTYSEVSNVKTLVLQEEYELAKQSDIDTIMQILRNNGLL